MLCLIAGLFWVIDRNKILKQKYVKINETLTQQIVENKNYQLRIKQLYQMDTQRLQELASAKSEIDRLRSYAERDPERVYIRASCATNDANSTSRVDDATRARPTDAAIRNYWILQRKNCSVRVHHLRSTRIIFAKSVLIKVIKKECKIKEMK
ncbi:phage protein [Proteus mirabilis]|uniref:Phage protein n=1 Tax=Proteus mirabilis TaxID=584 RepID=A0A379GG96_PROMI|nr:phage protein [Proteus mirabilis]